MQEFVVIPDIVGRIIVIRGKDQQHGVGGIAMLDAPDHRRDVKAEIRPIEKNFPSRRFETLRKVLPGLPDEEIQTAFVGFAGDLALGEGFKVYRLWKGLAAKFGRPVTAKSHVLDFGCGWRRWPRLFLARPVSRRPMCASGGQTDSCFARYIRQGALPPGRDRGAEAELELTMSPDIGSVGISVSTEGVAQFFNNPLPPPGVMKPSWRQV